ncbi:adenylate/guanylate cyclase domain-containing protein [Roseibium aggregatum]|uniref:HAMP domain-containing protein n=1 Tax=Roseibium aggregatum TaxID=187304 RepID=A0A926P1H6_9HYPH|nr:adenylate/guanylate cyclase domain-containing protein [Roseibium aggregatum]MBD1545141.1 HAMP domain-containing protein [Roseibium aggregatum]
MLPKRFRITPTLTSVIGAFVFITAALVLLVQAYTSQKVVRHLGGELVDTGMRSLEGAFNDKLDAVVEMGHFTAEGLKSGGIPRDDPDAVAEYLYGSLAAMPHVSFVAVSDQDGNTVEIDRGKADDISIPNFIRNAKNDPILGPLLDEAAKSDEPFWTKAKYLPGRGHSYIGHITPVRIEGKFAGIVIVAMSLHRVSDITRDISSDMITVFLMEPGTNNIFAHPALTAENDQATVSRPLMDVAHVPDEFLSNLASTELVESGTDGKNRGHELRVGYDAQGHRRFILLDNGAHGLKGFPVRLGAHFPAEVLEQPLHQLSDAALIGVALLGLSLIGAGILSHHIGSPIRRAAKGARAVARLDLDAVLPLPHSMVRELDDLSTGFNAMVGGLSAFMRYMPKTLVTKLIREGRADTPPEERDLTVLFTDIVGFTSLSESMSATEVAAFVNHHLTLIGSVIEAHGGTIDKYVGDSVMAFWGAPERIENPVEPAARAALDIARIIHEDNLKRKTEGLPPVHIRIGLHGGALVVGDIGAPSRVNYTVIGDTVNVASRLESLGREVDPTAEVIILASREFGDSLPGGIGFTRLGEQKVKGKDRPVEVIRLNLDAG